MMDYEKNMILYNKKITYARKEHKEMLKVQGKTHIQKNIVH